MGVLKELDLSGKRVTPPSTPWNLPSSQETPGAGVTTTEYNLAKIQIRSPGSFEPRLGVILSPKKLQVRELSSRMEAPPPFLLLHFRPPRPLANNGSLSPSTCEQRVCDPLEALPHATQLHQVSVRLWRSEVPHVPRLHKIPPPSHNTVCKVVPEVELHKKLAQARQECLQEPVVFGDPSLLANCSAQHAANSVRLARLARPERHRASLQ